MKVLKKKIIFISLIALSIFAILPLLNSGFFNIHDDAQVQRVYEMKQALSDGMFPVRWVPDLGYGYGYPIFNFYGPVPYYIGGVFMFLGFDALFATKIMLIVAIIGSSFSMYLLAKHFWGRVGGLVSAGFYLFAPYHALDIYVRGDFGEVYAYFLIPLVFYGLWKYSLKKDFKFILIGSLSYAGIIASHNLTAMMISPFILITVILLFMTKKNLSIMLIPILGIILASFYWIPTLFEMNYTNVLSTIGGKAHYADHFVCIRQFWDSQWMYGGSIPGCVDGLSFRLGKLHIIFSGLSLISGLYLFRKEKQKAIVVFLTFIFLLSVILLMISQSNFIWERVPYMDFFQYPWRFLLAASFFSSFLAGSIVYVISKFELKKYRLLVLSLYAVAIISPIILYSKLFIPQNYLQKSSEDYTNSYSLNWTTSKISDEYMPKSFKTPKNPSEIIKNKISGENIEISDLDVKANKITAKIVSVGKNEIIVHIPYFPAWSYYINGQKIEVNENEVGVSLVVPDGESELLGKFEQTKIEKIGNLLSISGVLFLVAGIIYAKRKHHE